MDLFSSPSPPPAPDPTQTANAQSQSNIQTAIANARLNRVSQQTPWGSITYSQGAPDANGVPTYSSQITLSPEQQALLEQQQGMQYGRNALAQQYLGEVTGQPLDFSHLHGIDDRGQIYNGAVNAVPPPAPHALQTPPSAPTQQTQQPSTGSQDGLQQLIDFLMNGGGQTNGTPNTATPAAPQTASGTPGMNVNTGAPGNPLDALLQGRPLNGTTGFNIENVLAQQQSGTDQGYKAQLAQMGLLPDQNGYYSTDFSKFTANGQPMINGKPMVQLKDTSIGGPGEPIDPSQVVYDPTYGLVTPQSNIKPISNGYGDLVFGIGSLGLGLPTAMAAMGGMAGTAGGVPDISTSDLGSLAPSGFGGSGGTVGADLVGTGAPVIDNSIEATNPSIFSRMGQNFMNGRGLLGLSPVQRAGVGLLPSILRGMSQRNPGGH